MTVHAERPTTPQDKSRELQRKLYLAAKRKSSLECRRKKVVGEPYEGKPHVRFEVAGDGNQDMVWVIEALSKETESKQATLPKSQAPSLDPTSGR